MIKSIISNKPDFIANATKSPLGLNKTDYTLTALFLLFVRYLITSELNIISSYLPTASFLAFKFISKNPNNFKDEINS